MRGMKMTQMTPTRPHVRGMKNTPLDRVPRERLIRRSANHNVHVITPHGKVYLGRKGRSG